MPVTPARPDLDHDRVVIALQAVMNEVDYDTHKYLMGLEDGRDDYDDLADSFVLAYFDRSLRRGRLELEED